MKIIAKLLLITCLGFLVVTTQGYAEAEVDRYQVLSANVQVFNEKGDLTTEPVVFLTDKYTGKTWTYERGEAEGKLISLWRPVVPANKVMAQTKDLVGKARGQNYMEEARILAGDDFLS